MWFLPVFLQLQIPLQYKTACVSTNVLVLLTFLPSLSTSSEDTAFRSLGSREDGPLLAAMIELSMMLLKNLFVCLFVCLLSSCRRSRLVAGHLTTHEIPCCQSSKQKRIRRGSTHNKYGGGLFNSLQTEVDFVFFFFFPLFHCYGQRANYIH